MGGRHSRDKGARFEQWVAKKLKTLWPESLRGLGQARSAKEVPDVKNTPYWVECKRYKRCNIQKAWKQACKDTDGRECLVVTKDDFGPVLVTMSLEEFMRLWESSS